MIAAIEPASPYRVSVKVGGINAAFLVDTGSAVTIIDVTIVHKLGIGIKPQDFRFRSASGHSLQTNGQAQLSLEIAGVAVLHDCLVMSLEGLSCHGILGNDFITKHKGCIDSADKKLAFPWGTISLANGEKGRPACVNLVGGLEGDTLPDSGGDMPTNDSDVITNGPKGGLVTSDLPPALVMDTNKCTNDGVKQESSEHELNLVQGCNEQHVINKRGLDVAGTNDVDVVELGNCATELYLDREILIPPQSYQLEAVNCFAPPNVLIELESRDPFAPLQVVPSISNVKNSGQVQVLFVNTSDKPRCVQRGYIRDLVTRNVPLADLDKGVEEVMRVEALGPNLANSAQGNNSDVSPDFWPEGSESEMSSEDFLSLFKYDESSVVYKPLLEPLLLEFRDVFVHGNVGIGCTCIETHKIDTGDAEPVRRGPYPIPHSQHAAVKKAVQEMLDAGVCRESNSPWNAPLLLVPKKYPTGAVKYRPCLDLRGLNKVTKRENFPYPNLQESLDNIGSSRFFSLMDLCSGFWQVSLDEKSIEKTSFATPFGQYEMTRMAYGLRNAPSTFVRLMSKVMGGIMGQGVTVYVDDVLVHTESVEDHLRLLREVFTRLRAAGLRLKPAKCSFFRDKAEYLGHLVRGGTMRPDPDKVRAIEAFPRPHTVTEVRSFLGLSNFYRRFVKGYAAIALPLTNLTRKMQDFTWTDEEERAFQALKGELCKEPVLICPRYDIPFIVTSDGSAIALGAVLSQILDKQEHPVAYASHKLRPPETKFSATEIECYAAVFACRSFRQYIYGYRFTLRTDHSALVCLFNLTNPKPRLARWVMEMAEYEYEVKYIPGKKNAQADALSRVVAAVSSAAHESWRLPEVVEAQNQDEKLQEAITSSPEKYCKDEHGLTYVKSDHGKILYVPALMVPYILEMYHDSPLGGHQGVQRTYERVRKFHTWKGMYSDVRDYVLGCLDCQKRKGRALPPPPPQLSVQPLRPFQRVSMDIVGPLPVTKRGNRVILTFVDCFTRWPEAIPLPDQKARTIARAFVEGIICRHGVPDELITDLGRNFVSVLFAEVCRMLHIRRITTTPSHPQGNAKVERSHQGLMAMLTQYVSPSQDDWDNWIPFAMFVARTSVHSATQFSPAFLTYGRELAMPWLSVRVESESDSNKPEDFALEMAQRLSGAYELAAQNSKEAAERARDQKQLSCVPRDVEVGDLVLIRDYRPMIGKSRKLAHKWRGPYRVVDQRSIVTYDLEDTDTGRVFPMHICNMKPVQRMRDDEVMPGDTRIVGTPRDVSRPVETEQTSVQNERGTEAARRYNLRPLPSRSYQQ
jgi:transposase InsO family protein